MTATNGDKTTRQVGKLTIREVSDREAELTRVFDAPRRLVWEAISKPEHYPHWWGPRSQTMISCELDFRPGGTWRFVMRDPDGTEYAFQGKILEVVPLERVVQTFEFEGMPGAVSVDTMTLTEHDGKTTLTATSKFDSPEAASEMVKSGMEYGAAETYDRLEELLHTMA